MSKPLNENTTWIRIENENGDLLALMEHAGDKFSELVTAVETRGKAGTFTLKITLKPSTAGSLSASGEVTIKKPKGLPAESLLWATPEGNLLAEDPKQQKLELKAVPEQARELKQVNA